ncbi:MAG TPA: beta-galactosidase [Candidatus Eisenbergiella pullicola]|nr:beta-galactosidase [Candidatus Eisenbergiella pullicola]
MNTIPRPEHPQPQLQRKNWENLNGEWEFAFDFGKSGIDRKLWENEHLEGKILVPFCPESELSGIGHKDFIPAVWYKRKVRLDAQQLGGRVLLHFGAVDYDCRVWVNGREAGRHRGGYTSFAFDVTDCVSEGENDLTVYAQDDTRSGRQPKGKQSGLYFSHGCDYTRTTGIWQTVWMEFVPKAYIQKVWYYPNLAQRSLGIRATVAGSGVLTAEAFYEGKSCGTARAAVGAGNVLLTLPLDELHLWEPGQGRLYDLKLTFGQDEVQSYFGMREIALDGEKVRINGKSVFQRLVLDQGFYPDGIYTAPSDEALRRDVELSLAAGFNGARLHQKVFEPRFLYHCDRSGYLVWGEQANWGLDVSAPDGLKCFLPEWMEALERDFNHPAIVGWCPFNETWDYEGRKQDDDLLRIVYRMTKQYDTTRPCIDTSGNYHVETDIYDLHDYEQDPEVFAGHYESFAKGGALRDNHAARQTPVPGIPAFISEYGGIKWDVEGSNEASWGYGDGPKTEGEFIARYKGLTDALLDNPHMFGFCYTQLYDVEQETNGLYTYGRKPKFDMETFRKINGRRAAIEEE